MEFVKQYIKIINYLLMGLVFGFTSFYLFANLYHYLEIRKDFILDVANQPMVHDIDTKMNQIEANLSAYNANTYQGRLSTTQMTTIYYNIKACTESFKNKTFTSLKQKNRITIVDVYNLRESYEDDILSSCIVNNLYWTTTLTESTFPNTYLVNNKEMIQLYINSLLTETSYLKKDLLNNSSYFFNTTVASNSMKDNTKDGFYEVMNSYGKAANFVEFISNWFKNEVEGNYD